VSLKTSQGGGSMGTQSSMGSMPGTPAMQGGMNRMSSGSQNQGYGLRTSPIPGSPGAFTGNLANNPLMGLMPILGMFGGQQSMMGQSMGNQPSSFFGGSGQFGMPGVGDQRMGQMGGGVQAQPMPQMGGGTPNMSGLASNFQNLFTNPAFQQMFQPQFQYR
jgi:hypothetical protein